MPKAAGQSLLEILQRLIERTYGLETGIQAIGSFVVGDRGLRHIYGPAVAVGSPWAGARLLVRQDGSRLLARIYYPDALISTLEDKNPLRGLDAINLDAFAVFVEELDHLLTLADRSRRGRAVSLLELELHANVTKYLACGHFLCRSLGRPLGAGERRWLQWSLYQKLVPDAAEPEVRERYLQADRLGLRYARHLDRLAASERLSEIRQFHHLPIARAMARIQALPA